MARWAVLGGFFLFLSAAGAQDVFIGGRVDVELTVDDETAFDFGRLAGIDVTVEKPGVIDAYFDYSIAGGEGRVQELYLSPPQTRRWVDLKVGRFLLPFGDPRTDPVDRYVDGGRDLFDTYDGYRSGNVFLDTDVIGVEASRSFTPVDLTVAGFTTPDGDPGFLGRAVGTWSGARFGASTFVGKDTLGATLHQTAVHVGYLGHGVDAVVQGFLGDGSGDGLGGWVGRAAYRFPRVPLTLFVAETFYDDHAQTDVSSTRFGAAYRIDDHYRSEIRCEINDAPAAAGDDRVVFRFLGVF